MPGVVIVDVDDTTADLVPVWVGEFLKRYPECPNPCDADWIDWDVSPRVPEAFQKYFWGVLDEPQLYDLVQPIPGALEGVQQIRSWNYRVVFATSATNGHSGAKLRWLVKHGFLDSIIRQRDYIETFDKSLLRGNLIIDDRPKTCRDFAAVNGGRRSALLYLRPPAIHLSFREGLIAATDWPNVVERAEWMLRGGE
jgi:5'(3')-deoxyribonucleotidase